MTNEQEHVRTILYEALEKTNFIVEREGGCIRIHFAGADIGIAVFEYPDTGHLRPVKPMRICAWCGMLLEFGLGPTVACCCDDCKRRLTVNEEVVDTTA